MAKDGFPRILVADDAPAVARRIVLQIEEIGRFEVVGTAGDGGAALTLFRELAPDLLILDLNMPIMTGLELTRRLRAEGNDCLIYIMTSDGNAQVRQACLAAGANRFFDKITEFENIVPALVVDHPEQPFQ